MIYAYANNKGIDQPVHPHSLISAFVIHYLDCVMPLVSITRYSRLSIFFFSDLFRFNFSLQKECTDTREFRL